MDSSSNNFDLRPPLPLDHPYPASSSSSSTSDGDHAPGGCPALQEDDGYSAALSPNAKRTLQSVLCRMYASAEVMELGSETRFTALVLFQRYYFASNVGVHFLPQQQLPKDQQGSGTTCSSDSGASVPEKWREHLGTVAAACLFLGCKVEEEHRRIRDVINLSHMMDFAGARHANGASTKGDGECSSSNGKIHIHEADSPPDLDDEYWKAKERIVATEQEVLRMLRFDVSVSHPHRAVLLILDGLGINVMVVHDKGHSLVIESFTTLNDALFYPPALRHNVLPLACGAIQWAANHIFAEDAEEDKTGIQAGDSASAGTTTTGSVAGASLPPGPWWRRFGVSDGEIEGASKSLKRARGNE